MTESEKILREGLNRISTHNFEDSGNWKDDARMFQHVARETIAKADAAGEEVTVQLIPCPKHGETRPMEVEQTDGAEVATCECGVKMIREWDFLPDDEDGKY